jgi:hypothetical protein
MVGMPIVRIPVLLKREGFQINHKRVERIWRKKGLKVPQKQPKRKRLWFNDESCIRLDLSSRAMYGVMTLWLPRLKMDVLYGSQR